MYRDKRIETLARSEIKNKQLGGINRTLRSASASEYYKKTLPQEYITDLRDIEELPLTSKNDLRENFPYGFLALPLSESVRLHSSSGTTGNPTVIYHTLKDIEDWAELVARSIYMAGARREDVFQNMMGYGLFTGGLGFHYGAERLGMLTIPSGPGNSRRQIWFMKSFNTTVLHILPNYALRLYSILEEEGISPDELSLRIAFIGAEPHSSEIRTKIQQLYSIKAYNSYGLSEMYGPGVAFECPLQEGMHLWEDYFYPEIIDPDSGSILPDGEEGELVLTTLKREAMPLIRYRTRDLTKIIPGICRCGRTHRRIDRIKGRTDDMLIINGVNIFPVQIEKVIMKLPEVGKNYLIEIESRDHMDKLSLKVEVEKEHFEGTLKELENLKKRLRENLREELGVTPEIHLTEEGEIPVAEGKAVRVFDLRDKTED